MTADELRRLAEIAGLELQYSKLEGWYWYEENYNHTPWRPHESIEQAMMVAEAFTAFYVGKDIGQYFCGLAVPDSRGIKYLPKMHSTNIPLAICRAALAAKEG